jgi:hypothetical protein
VDVEAAGPATCFDKRKQRWSGLLWFVPGIKRNLGWAPMVWVGNKEKYGAFRRDQLAKHIEMM